MLRRLPWSLIGVVLFCLYVSVHAFQAGAQTDRAPGIVPTDNLIVLHDGSPGGMQHVVVIDTTGRVMGSYAINPQTGVIALKSVRNFAWDLELEAFNAAAPAPRDIKALLEKP